MSGLEVICLLLCYKIKYPHKITLLRGDHASSEQNKIYGFCDEFKRRYNVKIWKKFTNLFNYFPIVAIINHKIFCVHRGLSPELRSLQNIKDIHRPTDIPDCGLLCDLLNSDPDIEAVNYDENDKGVSVIFGESIVEYFLKKFDLDFIVRGNKVVDKGYEYFASKKLLTIFSATCFRGKNDNHGGILIIDGNLISSFKILGPVQNLKK